MLENCTAQYKMSKRDAIIGNKNTTSLLFFFYIWLQTLSRLSNVSFIASMVCLLSPTGTKTNPCCSPRVGGPYCLWHLSHSVKARWAKETQQWASIQRGRHSSPLHSCQQIIHTANIYFVERLPALYPSPCLWTSQSLRIICNSVLRLGKLKTRRNPSWNKL